MAKIVDCRKLACPEPVLQTRACITAEAPQSFTVLVDNQAACENVSRFLQTQGYAVTRKEDGPDCRLDAVRHGVAPAGMVKDAAGKKAPANSATVPAQRGEHEKTLVLILSDVLGSGDNKLGSLLMGNFLRTLPEMGDSLWRIIFLNSGVKLTIADSPVLELIQALEKQSVSILACGSCLEFFGLRDKKAVGETTNMLDVVTSMQLADKVVRI